MAGTQAAAVPFNVWRLLNPNAVTPPEDRYLEDATQTFLKGVPVRFVAGYIEEMDTIDGVDDVIAGISDEFAHNLTTQGVAQSLSYGSVQNQPKALLIPVGAPLSDGRIQVIKGSNDVLFVGKTDDAHTVAVTDVGSIFGLTKDSGGGHTLQWFVDTTITVAANGACVEVVEAIDIGVVGGRVAFRITNAYQQLFT